MFILRFVNVHLAPHNLSPFHQVLNISAKTEVAIFDIALSKIATNYQHGDCTQ
jgi:hypothetical protein